MSEPFLKRVRIRNYKSIAECDVKLGSLTMLVGRNGSGKSNFLDALRFISDSLQNSLDQAFKQRGGIDSVRRRSTGHPTNFRIAVDISIDEARDATYEFEISAAPRGGYIVKHEEARILRGDGSEEASFRVANGVVQTPSRQQSDRGPNENSRLFSNASIPSPIMPAALPDRLYLVNASGLPTFRPLYDALSSMGFYNLNPEQMKEIQTPDSGELLRRDGSNIASVVSRLGRDREELMNRVREYLRAVVPDVEDFNRVQMGHKETLEFLQPVQGATHPWKFYDSSMSDGTLRTLGVLVAVMQLVNRDKPIRLVGIEEPETALHPAASAKLIAALREAARHTQILITTHSPDLLEYYDDQIDTLIAVAAEKGTTEIGPVDAACAEMLRNHLYTAGELLRMGQLTPEPASRNETQGQFAGFVGSK